jgi:hypothetical protein
MIHFELAFVNGVRYVSRIIFVCNFISTCSSSICSKDYWNAFFVEYHLTSILWIYFCAFSFLSVCISFFLFFFFSPLWSDSVDLL